MRRRLITKGFTLLELSFSMLFVSLLSIAVVIVINNTISAYQRGSVLSRLDSLGSSLVEDVRNSVQDSITRTKLGKNASITKTSDVTISGTLHRNVPIYGIFCSGSYTYFWNSGYYFSNDATFDEKNNQEWAKIQISDGIFYDPDGKGPNELGFRLAKVKDPERKVCFNVIGEVRPEANNYTTITIDNNDIEGIKGIFDISNLTDKDSITNLLPNNDGADLALYSFDVSVPVTNYYESVSLYQISIDLGTITGGVEPDASGESTCAAPLGDTNWSNSCAVSDFSFAVQSNSQALSAIEQTFAGNIPDTPSPERFTITYRNNNCERNATQVQRRRNGGEVESNDVVGLTCGKAKFLYWEDSSGTRFNPGDQVNPWENITLYAIWKEPAVITYSNEKCETNTYASLQFINEGYILGNDRIGFTCDDAEFINWIDGSGNTYNKDQAISEDLDLILYANWKTTNYYTITLYGNGNTNNNGTTLNSIITISNIAEGTTIAMPGTKFNDGTKDFELIKRNYVFAGWGVAPTDVVASYYPGSIITVNSDMDFYAIWTKDIGNIQRGYTEIPEKDDMIIDVLTIFPPYNTNFNLSNTGNFANTAIRPMKYTLEGQTANDVQEFIETLPYPICESFITKSDGKIGCGGSIGMNFTARIYLLRGTGGSPSVLYLPINERNISLDKSLYTTYISNPKDLNQVINGIKQSYSYAGMNGNPIALDAFPYRFDFSDYDIEDTIIATNNLPNIITGASGTVDSNTPRYWVIAAITYSKFNKTIKIDKINRFTDADPSSFAH